MDAGLSATKSAVGSWAASSFMLAEMRCAVDMAVAEYLYQLELRLPRTGASPELFSAVCEVVRREGRRGRALLFLVAWQGYTGRSPEEVMPAAVALELYHDFVRIAGELADKRAGRISRLAEVGSGAELIPPIRDVLFAGTVGAFISLTVGPRRKFEALQAVMDAALATSSGAFTQALVRQEACGSTELATIAELQELKSARYSFACPLIVAGILAGRRPEELPRLSEYGSLVGKAYQIHSDVQKLREHLDSPAGEAAGQPEEIRELWPFMVACRTAVTAKRHMCENLLQQPRLSDHGRLALAEFVESSGAFDAAAMETANLMAKGEELLAELSLNPETKRCLHYLVSDFFLPLPISDQ